MKYIKVVKRTSTPEIYHSFFAKKGLCREYKVGEWVEADPFLYNLGYGLFVFKQHEYKVIPFSDIAYALQHDNIYRIFTCDIQERMPLPKRGLVVLELNNLELKQRMREEDWNTTSILFPPYPKYTQMCKKVKLLKDVTENFWRAI